MFLCAPWNCLDNLILLYYCLEIVLITSFHYTTYRQPLTLVIFTLVQVPFYVLRRLCKLNKTPSDGTCLGEPPGSFCDVGCCCCFTSLKVFLPSLLFDVIPYSSVTYGRVFTAILYFHPSSSQSDSRHFHLTSLGFSVTALLRLLRFSVGVFYPQAFFTLHSFPAFWHVLWLRCGQEHPIQDRPLCLPSQSCHFRLTHGLELLIL